MVEELSIGRGLPLVGVRSTVRTHAALQNDPHFPELAARLLTVAAREEEAARRGRSQAFVHRVFSSGDQGASQWGSYVGQLEAAAQRGPLSTRELRSLAAQAPGGSSAAFQELVSILSEPDREIFAASLLNLAERNLDRDGFPLLTQELLTLAAAHPRTRARAQSLLTVMAGGGSFAQQLEYQAPHLLNELSSPVTLGSFALAGLAARGASFAVFSRSARYSFSTLVASEGAAWLAEVPTLVLTRRLGAQLFLGGENLWEGRDIGLEMLLVAGPFLLLRGASNAFEFAAPTLRRAFQNTQGEVSSFGHFAMGGTRFGTEVSAMMLGNSFNAAVGLSPQPYSAWNNFYQSLLATGNMRLAGRLLERSGLVGFSELLAAQKARLIQASSTSFDHFSPPWQSFLEPWGVTGQDFVLATAGSGGVRRPFDVRNEVFMVGEGPGGGGSGGEGPPGSGPKSSPGRLSVLSALLRGSMKEYLAESGPQETRLRWAASRLTELLDRMGEQPDLANDQPFAQALAEVRAALAEAQQTESKIGRSWRTLKVLMQDFSETHPRPEVIQEAQTQEQNLERDQAQRAQELRELNRLQKILGAIGKFGNSERLQGHLKNAATRLNQLFRGTLKWTIPGMRRGAAPDARLQDHLQATMMGLSAKGWGLESPTAQELRGEAGRLGEDLDSELEFLHQTALLTAERKFNPEGLTEAVQALAAQNRVSEKSSAAMILTAEALSHYFHRTTESPEPFVVLNAHPNSGPLQDHFRDLNSLLDDGIPMVDGLSALGQESLASDYLVTGLYVLMRSHGDPANLREGIRAAQEAQLIGFHPSIPLSLFGAAHGRELLPRDLLPPQTQLDRFLEHALPKESEKK